MPDQCQSAVYHIADPEQLPPGRLVHAEDEPGGLVDIYLHPLHASASLVWEFNWATSHLVRHGLWRQRWTDDGRMREPAQGLGVAECRWQRVPAETMPSGRGVIGLEEPRRLLWLVRSSLCTVALCDAINHTFERLVGDGLWQQRWYECPQPPAGSHLAPAGVPISG